MYDILRAIRGFITAGSKTAFDSGIGDLMSEIIKDEYIAPLEKGLDVAEKEGSYKNNSADEIAEKVEEWNDVVKRKQEWEKIANKLVWDTAKKSRGVVGEPEDLMQEIAYGFIKDLDRTKKNYVKNIDPFNLKKGFNDLKNIFYKQMKGDINDFLRKQIRMRGDVVNINNDDDDGTDRIEQLPSRERDDSVDGEFLREILKNLLKEVGRKAKDDLDVYIVGKWIKLNENNPMTSKGTFKKVKQKDVQKALAKEGIDIPISTLGVRWKKIKDVIVEFFEKPTQRGGLGRRLTKSQKDSIRLAELKRADSFDRAVSCFVLGGIKKESFNVDEDIASMLVELAKDLTSE